MVLGSHALLDSHNLHLPCWHVMPEFLSETKYRNPTDILHSPFQKAHSTDLTPFPWMRENPKILNNFNVWMAAWREGQNNFLDVFSLTEFVLNSDPATPLFVDIGGGIGHQCLALRKRLPNVPGRVIFQDLLPVIAQAIQVEGVEPMVHDFMSEQPIKGMSLSNRNRICSYYPIRLQ